MDTKYIVAVVLIGVLLSASSATLGYFFALSRTSSTPATQANLVTPPADKNPTIQSQTASVTGKITKSSPTTLTVTTDDNKTGEFPLSKRFMIYKPIKNTQQSSPSADLSLIDPNQTAYLTLELVDNKYQVISVTYLPAVTSTPPAIPTPTQPKQ